MRLACVEDAAFIVGCFAVSHAKPFLRKPSPERACAAVEDPDVVSLVLEADGVPAGHLLLRRLTDTWSITEISQLVVCEPRRGHGRFAIEFAKHFAFSERGAHRLHLDVVAHNTAARKLYEFCGFTYEGTFRDGFPADDGAFCDLAIYGMLESEFRTL
ncbi:MAG: GNAT family N-acetyltransferase [Candidatus Eremiobacteraeota bacterium]|nr:GNAT family N-acetyltransferase [Candidatus Eremiobacteraeota bacterium]